MSVFLGSREPFCITEDAISVNIKPIVITIKGQVAGVQWVKGRARIAESDEVKPSHPMAHVGFVAIRHPVSIGV